MTDALPPLAAALDAERTANDLSLNELARLANLSPGRVHAILSGATPNPGVLTVRAICLALGRDLAWLGRRLK
ncbi:MAG TPA: helix-turn-helix transcriptional regulator [Fimbriiglobus sp.]|nr:helix-turn-helix transcriptional regulator [Fimbriiglobus sp.]